MFYQDIFLLHEAFPPRGQSADLSTVVSQEIKMSFYSATCQLYYPYSSMRAQLLFWFMGSFIEEIYYAQSDFMCKQRGCAGCNFQFTLMHQDMNMYINTDKCGTFVLFDKSA